ncbi:single-stranded-DNA-specific exonuclease RecJ [Penaeicola halotolerans]|uniref:single-stranded-DNA-specific exonuclease RecJ n=1 Tax=Penaeicola halotolerans TaxID=2793196 RepID=UPI001CF8E173|nr:single-stranded-DNA-specific exonuclease RecJ [Penaeicola halotolerans]
MQYRWEIKSSPEAAQVDQLAQEINVSPILAALLINRGIEDFDQAKAFFRPSLDQLHDPFLMQDMEAAVNRVLQAMQKSEKIMVYGDYDVDGTTSVAMFYSFLKSQYDNVCYYIPDRYKEGYGVSIRGIETAEEQGVKLIVSLDCGIKAVEKVTIAKSKGIDFIICDHHTPGEQLPEAVAVLDPKRTDCSYPYKELSGCGVGFKLIQAIVKKLQLEESIPLDYLDLLAVSIASDIVPITGENRVLAHFGLTKLNNQPRPGLKALIDLSDYRKSIDINSIVFTIGPRINASGRIKHAHFAVELLLADTRAEADTLAASINKSNEERRVFDQSITKDALELIEQDEAAVQAKSTVLFKEDWHKGLIGIVASRCIEKYYKPTIILTASNEKATGSARSVDGFDVYEAIEACADLLDQFGGHKYAAGLTMPLENIPAFREKFEAVVSERITEDMLTPKISIDQKVRLDQIHSKMYKIIEQMQPFGPENTMPLFYAQDLYAENVRLLKEQHLKFTVRQDHQGNAIDCIAFQFAPYYEMIASGMRFQMAFYIEENWFRDKVSIQLRVKDIKFE